MWHASYDQLSCSPFVLTDGKTHDHTVLDMVSRGDDGAITYDYNYMDKLGTFHIGRLYGDCSTKCAHVQSDWFQTNRFVGVSHKYLFAMDNHSYTSLIVDLDTGHMKKWGYRLDPNTVMSITVDYDDRTLVVGQTYADNDTKIVNIETAQEICTLKRCNSVAHPMERDTWLLSDHSQLSVLDSREGHTHLLANFDSTNTIRSYYQSLRAAAFVIISKPGKAGSWCDACGSFKSFLYGLIDMRNGRKYDIGTCGNENVHLAT